LRLLCNRRDELAFKRLVMMAPGIGEKASAKLWQQFSPPLEHAATASLTESFNQLSASIPRKAAAFWVQLAATIAQLEAEHSSREPARLVPLWQEAVYREYLKDNYATCRSRLEDLERLTAFSARFASLEEFLGELALLTNVEAESDDTARTDEERLRLSTVHQAKGLEWSVVFVIMLCEEMFPARLSVQDAEGEEEERRLFYVALTRAKRELYLCRTVTGTARDGDANIRLEPSRFIKDIPRELFEEWDYLFYRA
jgi:DNA helicase-2/ATP-dependent DNA helicase PcrA